MPSRSAIKTAKSQKGLALMVLVIVIVLGFTSYSLLGLSVNEVKTDKRTQTQISLKKAKNGLIAYAVANWEIKGNLGYLGKLPCPDFNSTSGEGAQDSGCGSSYANGIGYFPWRTLGLDVPKDGDSCLLYAVSPAYKTTPAAALNPDSFGQFQVVDENGAVLIGDSPENRPVAVVIAPAEPLAGQSRSFDATTICGSDYDTIKNDLGAYLDNDGTTNNAALDPDVEDVIDQLVQAYASNSLNDRIVVISYNDIWDRVKPAISSTTFNSKMETLTEALAICFANYGLDNVNHLPMPTPLDLSGGKYRRDSDYDDSAVFTANFAGRLPYDVKRSNTKIGNGKKDYIFHVDNGYCDGIDLVTTAGAENINFSDDTGSDNGEYFDLWQNWKDHFFYAVSKAHNPSVTSVAACASDCVKVGVKEYAGIVFFSGHKQNTQQRYTSIFDSASASDLDDDKDDVVNYMEENRDTNFPDASGNSAYNTVGAGSNDVMFCINTDMSVEAC